MFNLALCFCDCCGCQHSTHNLTCFPGGEIHNFRRNRKNKNSIKLRPINIHDMIHVHKYLLIKLIFLRICLFLRKSHGSMPQNIYINHVYYYVLYYFETGSVQDRGGARPVTMWARADVGNSARESCSSRKWEWDGAQCQTWLSQTISTIYQHLQ